MSVRVVIVCGSYRFFVMVLVVIVCGSYCVW